MVKYEQEGNLTVISGTVQYLFTCIIIWFALSILKVITNSLSKQRETISTSFFIFCLKGHTEQSIQEILANSKAPLYVLIHISNGLDNIEHEVHLLASQSS